jgi:hypothetical protein
MFVLCPHCQFLVTVDPRTGVPPSTCPKCGKSMEDVQEAQSAESDVVAAAGVAAEVEPPAPGPEPVIEPAPDVAPDVAPEPEPAPTPAQRSADDFIAAMAQKSPRKPRAKSRAAKAVSASVALAKVEPPAPPPKAPKVKEPPGPSLSTRMSAWFQSIKPKPRPKKAAPVDPATPEPERRKATVKPVPSLRDRAAKRAADKAEAAAAAVIETVSPVEAVALPAPIETPEPPRVETPPIEFIPLAQTPVEAALAVEALVPAPPPADAQPVAASPVIVAPAPFVAAPTPTPAPTPTATPPSVTRRPAAHAPSFARRRGAPGLAMPAQWRSFATIGGLALLLALQLLLAQRDALAANARWRPTMSAVCTVLRCTLPPWHEPETFTMLSRDVRPHPQAAGTLQIDASFRNDARWPQAWPRLVVNLSDIDGRVLGTRAFTAREYLGDDATTQSVLGPGQTAAIRLAVVEPAPGVVAFSFEFR